MNDPHMTRALPAHDPHIELHHLDTCWHIYFPDLHFLMVTTSLDLDLAFDTVDATVDRACTSLLSPLSHFSPPISSPPSSAAAGEPM